MPFSAPSNRETASAPLFSVASGTTSFIAGSVLRLAIDDTATPKCDKLALGGSLKVATGAAIDLAVTGTPTQPVYELVSYSGAAPSAAFTVTNLPAGYRLEMSRGGNTVALVKLSKVAPTSQDGTSFSYTLPGDAPARFVRARIELNP